MRSARVVLGMVLIVAGLVLSFVFPIMAIVPNMVIEYPPSQAQSDGATFSEGKYLFQEFTSDINLKFVRSTDAFWVGMWRDEGITIPEGYGIIGKVINRDPNIQDGDFSSACFNVDIDQIPTGTPGYVKVRWIDDADYPHAPLCKYLRPYGHTPDFLEFEIGKTYRIYMYAVNSMVEHQGPDNALALPGVFWQWSTVANPEDSGESSVAVATYFDKDLSFALSSGTYEEVETTETPPIEDKTPGIVENAGAVVPVFLGAIFLAFGVVILLVESNLFEFRRDTFWYPVFLIIIGVIIFTVAFFFANRETFWWDWGF